MCDTQALIAGNGLWFAKNSDREPHEPQAVVRLPAVSADPDRRLQTTYLEIPQVPDRHAVILSKPCWIWGAEMGVNEHGLAIGNEAIFSRQRSLRPALLGMDLLRLALERCATAPAAIDTIAELLGRYGQGGPAGYRDKGFHYDSSFLILDPREAWVMETSGRDWAARPITDYAAISNALSITGDYTRASAAVHGRFADRDSRLLPWLARSRQRREQSLAALAATRQAGPAPGFAQLADQLRRHAAANEAPLDGSNADLCMHAAGPVRRSQTTGSMVAWLGPHGPRIAVTGTSAPCLALFRPLDFEHRASVLAPATDRAPLWQQWEPVQRAALFDAGFRARLRSRIAVAEAEIFAGWMQPQADFEALDDCARAAAEEILAWPRPPLPRGPGFARRLWRTPPACA